MKTSATHYEGGLRTTSTHVRSGNSIITDAPPDNHGLGQAFSPTDLTATSLVTCMITIMGITAEKHQWKMGEVDGSVEKIMAEGPRRIIELNIEITFRNADLDAEKKAFLERAAINCPVAKSLHPDIRQNVKFIYE